MNSTPPDSRFRNPQPGQRAPDLGPDSAPRTGPPPVTGGKALDETLRLIARVPAPEGIENRVHAALRAAPRRGRILFWPKGYADTPPAFAGSSWLRTAAAAAIVFAVAGGGWGVYTSVQHSTAKAVVMPVARPIAGPAFAGPAFAGPAFAKPAFSSAGAMRTPTSVKGPVLAQPPTRKSRKKAAAKKTAAKAVPSRSGAPIANGVPNASASGGGGR